MKYLPSLKSGIFTAAFLATALMGINVAMATAQSFPFTGVIVKSQVDVRAGAGPRYYIVGHLKKGDHVTVKEIIFGWNKIVPPKDEYSYIPVKFVDANAAGTSGTVNTDNTTVTAGNLKGPGESYRQQVTLSKDSSVTILGKEGDYYKIAPPENAVVFLAPGSIRRAAALQQEKSVTEKKQDKQAATHTEKTNKKQDKTKSQQTENNNKNNATTQSKTVKNSATKANPAKTQDQGDSKNSALKTVPANENKTAQKANTTDKTATNNTPKKESAPPKQTPSTASKSQVKTPAKAQSLIKVEQQMLPYFKEPISKQPLNKMKAAYEKLAKDTSLSQWDHTIINARLKMIARNQQLASTLAQIKQVQQNIKQQENEKASIKKPAPPQHYDLVGYLSASTIYNGTNLPQLYRLTDTQGHTLTYVSPKAIDTHKMLGRLVGIIGKQYHNSTLDINIFQIKRIYILSKENKSKNTKGK